VSRVTSPVRRSGSAEVAQDDSGLIVFEGDEATVFWSADEAARWLDADDVRAAVHEIFTLDGHVVRATVVDGHVELTVGELRAEALLAERIARTCDGLGLEAAPDDVLGVARELHRRDW
jgi:hypothetical protein